MNPKATISRRSLLVGGSVVVAGVGAVAAVPLAERMRRDASAGPSRPYCMAMHVHACWSEGPGSMEAQLTQAAETGVDVLWWTEHDQRMSAHGYRRDVHFDGSRELEDGQPWYWKPKTTGKARTVRHEFVTDVFSPRDAGKPGSLRLGVDSAGFARHLMQGVAAQDLMRTSLDGQTIQIDVRPAALSGAGYLALELVTSYRPERNGRPGGNYTLSYRIGGTSEPGSLVTKDDRGIITIDAPVDEWTTLTLRPVDDIAGLWPGVDGRDASLFELYVVAATMGGGPTEGYFDRLRFLRTRSDTEAPLRTQAALIRGYENQFPTVRQIQALEVSLTNPHLSWYGRKIELPDHAGEPASANLDPAKAAAAVKLIHSRGGIASYNHMFGTTTDRLSETEQEKARRIKAAELVVNRALDCDLLEVGYRLRGGCTLERHLSVWDTCSRNVLFLTGIGVSDDHKGKGWLASPLNFVTWVWSASDEVDDLIDALRRGRAYFGDPARFRGRIDLLVDGRVRMGAVDVSTAATRELEVDIAGLPEGATVDVVRGDADLAGADEVDPVVTTTTLAASDFDRNGRATVEIDTSAPRFVRVEIKMPDGLAVGFSNPVWLLRERPPRGVPTGRLGR